MKTEFLDDDKEQKEEYPKKGVLERLKERNVDIEKINMLIQALVPHVVLDFASRFKDKSPRQIELELERVEKAMESEYLFSKEFQFRGENGDLQVPENLQNKRKQHLLFLRYLNLLAMSERYLPKFGFNDSSSTLIPSTLMIQKDGPSIVPVPLEEIIKFLENTLKKYLGDRFEELKKQKLGKGLISKRALQGWPVFTKYLIPALYEYLHPFYHERKGHVMSPRNKKEHPASYPTYLMKDITDLLKLHFPNTFQNLTPNAVKAVIDRYLLTK